MEPVKYAVLIVFGLGSGVAVSAGVFTLIASIGIVPRMAEKTKTSDKIPLYEDAISLGGIIGTLLMFTNPHIPIGRIGIAVFGFCIGVFFGELAVSLAEVLNVFPIFMRRFRMKMGISFFIPTLALGKCIGSLLYYFVEGFHHLL